MNKRSSVKITLILIFYINEYKFIERIVIKERKIVRSKNILF